MSDELFPEPQVALPPMQLCEHVVEDYVATGLSLKEHPVRFFRERLTRLGAIRNAEHRSEDLPQDSAVTVAGLVLMRQMPGTAKGVVFMTLEDETDIANIIVWPKMFAKNRRIVMTSRFLAVRGRLQRAGLVVHVVAERFIDLSAELQRLRDGDLFAPEEPPARKAICPCSRAAIFIEVRNSKKSEDKERCHHVWPCQASPTTSPKSSRICGSNGTSSATYGHAGTQHRPLTCRWLPRLERAHARA